MWLHTIFHFITCFLRNSFIQHVQGKFGRLGLGSERNCHSPRLIEDFTGTNAKQIACGGFHTAVVTDDGKVYTFGGGEHGQLGHGDKFNRVVPTLVQALENEHISQITCGWSHTVVLTPRGVCSFGNGEHGKLGHGTIKKLSTPSLVEKLKGHRVVSIASYNEHTAALVEPLHDSGAVWGAFGTNTVPVTTSFLRNMRDMVDNDEFSDVIFKVDNDFVYAHKSILASRCEHFAALLRSGMRETVEGEITIPNVTKPVFLLLMEYIYTDSVMIDMEYAVDLYVLADMYGLERLSNICVTVVKRNLSTFNATGILQHATDEDCIVLKDLAMEFVISNFERISKTDGIRLVSHEVLLDILSNRP
jgi:RCC1 and BTB domain-containing protein